MSWQGLLNPYSHGLKKYVFDLVGHEKYEQHKEIIERLSTKIETDVDYKQFGDFIICLYEAGFFRALDQQKEALQKMGLKVNVSAPKEEASVGEKIFKQNEDDNQTS